MITVCGCPRSGTSLMMDILRLGLGREHLIGGDVVPDEKRLADRDRRVMETGTPIEIYDLSKISPQRRERMERARCMNPKGFYECNFTVRGVYWGMNVSELYKRVKDAGERDFIKIVPSGIINTPPEMLSKVVYMLRDPRAVAKSQENIGGMLRENLPGKVHNPVFFIQATIAAATYLKRFPDVEYHVVEYDKLIEETESEIDKIAVFLGVDFDKQNAATAIDQDLRRSKAENVDYCDTWEEAQRIYDMFLARDLQGIIDFSHDKATFTQRHTNGFVCHRLGMRVALVQCDHCKTVPQVVKNFIKRAEQMKIDWRNEPCAFDCGRNPKAEPISIEQSIAGNHWQNISQSD